MENFFGRRTRIFFRWVLIILSLSIPFILFQACNRESVETEFIPIDKTYTKTITIGEAQQWFEKNRFSSNLRVASEKTRGRSVEWDKAGYYEFPFGKAVVIPLHYKESHTPRYSIDSSKMKVGDKILKNSLSDSDLDYLVVFKDKQENFHEEVLNVIPDEDYIVKSNFRKKSLPFDGLILVSNWNGDFIRGCKYENGQATKKVIETKKLRLADQQPVTTCETVDWYSCASGNDGQTWSCNYSYSSTVCTTTYVDTGGGWDYSYGDWATGGGGSSGGYNFDEHAETIESPQGTFVFPDEAQIARLLCVPRNQVHTIVTTMKGNYRSKFRNIVGDNPDVGYEQGTGILVFKSRTDKSKTYKTNPPVSFYSYGECND